MIAITITITILVFSLFLYHPDSRRSIEEEHVPPELAHLHYILGAFAEKGQTTVELFGPLSTLVGGNGFVRGLVRLVSMLMSMSIMMGVIVVVVVVVSVLVPCKRQRRVLVLLASGGLGGLRYAFVRGYDDDGDGGRI